MKWLAMAFFLELGLIPQDAALIYDPPSFVVQQPGVYEKLGTKITMFNTVFLGGEMGAQEWIVPRPLELWPNRTEFMVYGGLQFGPLQLGVREYCTHPIVPYLPFNPVRIKWEGQYVQVYIRLEGGT